MSSPSGKISQLQSDLRRLATPKKAKASAWFFRTGPGEYGHGDVFLGVTVPEQREVAKKYRDLPLRDIEKLLKSKIHEHRLTGVIILVWQFDHGTPAQQATIAKLYLKLLTHINNWDIVDSSASHILGTYLLDRPRAILYKLAVSPNLWKRRVSIIATQTFIRNNQFVDTLKISKILVRDQHDLIQKAVGWMLREVGDRNRGAEEKFLKQHAKHMPRTMLRYAIEKFPESLRKRYLAQN